MIRTESTICRLHRSPAQRGKDPTVRRSDRVGGGFAAGRLSPLFTVVPSEFRGTRIRGCPPSASAGYGFAGVRLIPPRRPGGGVAPGPFPARRGTCRRDFAPPGGERWGYLHSLVMRHALLLRSVVRLLTEGEAVLEAAYLWRRHPRMVLYALVAFAAMVLVAAGVGWDEWPSRFGFGLAAAAVVVFATTDYRVLARTPDRLVLCSASRIRQIARGIISSHPVDVLPEIEESSMLVATWRFDGESYSVPKSSERAMLVIGRSSW